MDRRFRDEKVGRYEHGVFKQAELESTSRK
jgi:hypothetical protein